jgi:uncharacterized radical SAM superfamily protein
MADIADILAGDSGAESESIADILTPVSPHERLLYELADVPVLPAAPPPEELEQKGPIYPENWMPDEEKEFKEWYKNWASEANIDPNPDDPRHHYDYRSAYRAGAAPTVQSDGLYHWPSQFKTPDHPNRFVDGVDTITGEPVGAPPQPLDQEQDTDQLAPGEAEAPFLLRPESQIPEAVAKFGKTLGLGLAAGFTTQTAGMVGEGMEYVGHTLATDRKLPDWFKDSLSVVVPGGKATIKTLEMATALLPPEVGKRIETSGKQIREMSEEAGKEWFDTDKEREGFDKIVFEGSKMMGPSILPAGISRTGLGFIFGIGKNLKRAKNAFEAGDLLAGVMFKNIANNMAKLATDLSSGVSALFFGLSQAGSTQRAGLKRAEELEAAGKPEEAKRVRDWAETTGPVMTGAIEALGEAIGTKYLAKFLRLDETFAYKRGLKQLIKDAFKTLGVELTTEVGQNIGEATVEHLTGITPQTQVKSDTLQLFGYDKEIGSILAAGLDAIGPTAFMTLLTLGMGTATNLRRPEEPKKKGEGEKPAPSAETAPEQPPEEGVLKTMGALPGEAAEEAPRAEFLGWQERAGEKPPVALYNIIGGERHGSTVTAETLKELGIAVPKETPTAEEEPEEAIPVASFKDLNEAAAVGVNASDEEVEQWKEARQDLLDEADFFKSTGKHKEAMQAIVEANKYSRAIEASEQPERYAQVEEEPLPQEQKASGPITEPSVAKSYTEAKNKSQPTQNVIVQPGEKPGKVVIGQIGTHTIFPEDDMSTPYFDKLYEVREGYVRPGDFWELPTWATVAANSLTDSDFMVVRDVDTAAKQITDRGYEAVLFSALEVNKQFIKQLAEKVGAGTRLIVGGYVDKSYFKDNPNIEFYDTLKEGVESLGYTYKEGVDTKHFKGTPTIPRLCMSKGCLHKCAFCSIPKGVKPESDESIDVQIAAMKGLSFNLVYLDDKTFGQAKNFVKLPDIANKIKEINPDFQGFVIQTTAPQLLKMDDEFLHYGKIKFVELGVESYNDDVLARIHKPARVKTIDAAVEKLRVNKIPFVPNIMVGLPGESKQSYLNTLRFLYKNEDIISHVNIYNLALYKGTELGDQLAVTEADQDENKVARSYMKNPKLHESFYNAVLRYGEKQLDKVPYTEVLTGEAAVEKAQLGMFKEKKKAERAAAKKLVEPEGEIIADTGEGVQKAVALTPEMEAALVANNVGVGPGRHRKNFVVSVSENSGLIYGPARTSDEKTTRTKDFLTGKQTITEYWRKVGGKLFKVLNTPIMPTTKAPKIKLLDKLVNDFKKELEWYTAWREQMSKFQSEKYSENDIDKMMKIQTILSAGTSPGVAQTLFGRVMRTLETGAELRGGKGTGIPAQFAEKIMRVWKGQDTDIQTLEQFQQVYGPKIGAMMFAALHPGTKEGAVVVDRHIARMWGYNALWGGSFRIPKHLQQEIVTDITETAKRFDLPVPAVQAALWYATGAGHWGSATHFEEAIRLNPAKSLGRAMMNLITVEPQAITSFRGKLYYSIRGAAKPTPLSPQETERLKALIQKSKEMKLFGDPLSDAEKLEFLNLRHKQQGDKPSPWSRNDVQKRMDADTEDNPYVPLGYWYGPGVRRETFFWGKEPHLTMLYEDEIYDAIADKLGYKEVAHERAQNDPMVKAGKRNWSDVYMNALAQVIQRSGNFKGFALDQNGNTWVFTFGDMMVEEHPKTVDIGLSDRVSNIIQLPQDLGELVDFSQVPARNLYDFIEKKLKDYPIKIEKVTPTLARLADTTFGETEYGLSLKVSGPITAIRAAFSDIIGLQKHQNNVIIFHGQGATNGTLVRFTFESEDINKVSKALKRYEINDFNIRNEGLKWVFETFISADQENSPEVIDKIVNLFDRKGVAGTLTQTPVNSEMLTREEMPGEPTGYQSHILKYFGKKKGAEVYDRSQKAGVEWAANSYLLYGTEAARAGSEERAPGQERSLSAQFREPEADDYGPQAQIVKVPAPVQPGEEELYSQLLQKYGSKALEKLAGELSLAGKLASKTVSSDMMSAYSDWLEEKGLDYDKLSAEEDKRLGVEFLESLAGDKARAELAWLTKLVSDPAFKRWFKKSAASNPGTPPTPRMLFHGTTRDFDTFQIGDLGYHLGTLRAAEMRLAAKGPEDVKDITEEEEKSGYVYGSSIMPVFVSIQNPLDMPDIGSWHRVDTVWRFLADNIKAQFSESAREHVEEVIRKSHNVEAASQASLYRSPKWIRLQQEGLQTIRESLWDLGYDGIRYANRVEDPGSESFIAFAPEQIKTIFNKGNWSDEYGELWAALAKKPVTFQALIEMASRPDQISKIITGALKASGLDQYADILERTQLILKPFINVLPKSISPKSLRAWAAQLNLTVEELDRQLASGERGLRGLTSIVDPLHAVVTLSLRGQGSHLEDLPNSVYHELYHVMESWLVPKEIVDKLNEVSNAEERAEDFAAYVEKRIARPTPSWLREIWDKIIHFLQEVRTNLLGLNITSAEQVFDMILDGKFRPHFGVKRMVSKTNNSWISEDLLKDVDQILTDPELSRVVSMNANLPTIEIDDEKTGKLRIKDLINNWMQMDQTSFSFMRPISTATKAFKKWFKKSAVAFPTGEPRMVFHGTTSGEEFVSFSDQKGRAGWFAEAPGLAGTYADYYGSDTLAYARSNRIIPAYLSLQNPFMLTAFDINDYMTPAEFHEEAGIPGDLKDWWAPLKAPKTGTPDTAPGEWASWLLSATESEHAAWQYFKLTNLTNWLAKNGYDGVFAEEKGHATWLAFQSTQVKSVFNLGGWSITNPDILAQIGDMPFAPDQKTQVTEEQDLTLPGIIELPEMIQIVQLLSGGKIPGVRERLFGRDNIRGVFMPSRGNIRLKADLFKDPYLAARVLAHEIGHLVDWLPDHMLSGNILGKIASIRRFVEDTLPYKPGAPGNLTPADIARLRAEAVQLLGLTQVLRTKWIDTTITTELKVTPEDILNIWNAVEKAQLFSPELYKYIAGLDSNAKKLIVKAALKGMVPLEVEKFAKTIKGPKTRQQVTEVVYVPPSQEAIAKKLAELIEKEIKTRKLWVEDEIRDELKTLSARWRPFDPTQSERFTHYRWSSEELYADAISVLFNDPAFLKSQAPKFFEAFFNYLDSKPDVKRVYNEIQREIRSGEVDKVRTERIFEMFDEGNEAYAKQYDDLSPDVPDSLKRDFFDTFHFILKDIRKVGEGNIAVNANPRYKLEDMVYTGSEIEAFLTDLYANVIKPLEKANLKWDREFGFLVFLRRLAIERDKMAAPLGWDAEKAINKMEAMKNIELTPDQWTALKTAVAKFRELHEKYFIDKAEANQIYDDATIKLFRDNTAYATFDVLPYLIERYGRAVATRIHHQIGTLQKISNPATATVMKDIAFMKAVNKSVATRAVVKFYQDYANVLGIEVKEATKKWNGRFLAIQEPKDRSLGLVVYLYKGKAYGYYLPKDIAEAINENAAKYTSVARVFRWLSQPFRKIFTELNYGFWIFNAFFRDAQRMVMALPGYRVDKFAMAWLRGLKPAFKSTFGIPDDVVQEMQRNHMLISVASIRDLNDEDAQIERLLWMYHMKPPKTYQNKILKPWGHLFNWVSNKARLAEYYFVATGQALERTTKVGTYKYLKENFPDMPNEVVGHLVRERGGSPDFLRAGREQFLYNNILLFVNAMKEGYRGDVQAFKDNPGEFMIKKFAFMVLPKLLMYAGLIGLLGAGIKDIFDGVTEYDLTNYIIIPLGRTKSGKVVYWRVPTDETSRFLGGLLWKILRAPELGIGHQATDIFDYMSGQAPTVSPAISIVADTMDYVGGQNPYDRFYGRHAVGEVEFAAYDRRAHLKFLQHLASKMGASIVYKFKHDNVEKIAEELESVLGFPISSKVADFMVEVPDAPVVSNILGRFLKVTDYGVREDIMRNKKKVARENAKIILDARDAAYALVDGRELTNEQVLALSQKPDAMNRAMMLSLARKYGMVYFEEWMSAGSTAERFAVLATMMEKNALSFQDVTGLASPPPAGAAKSAPTPAPSQEYPGLNIKELLEKETRK